MIERTFIKQAMKKIELEKYMRTNLDKAGFTHLDIVKTPLVTRIVLNVTKPGLAIGKGGQTIRQLTEDIETKFGINNPQIEIKEIENPTLDAQATVDKMVALLERGFSWRSIAFRTVKDIMAAGAQGCELVLSGKLTGKGGRKRKQRIAEGYMKKVGHQTELVDYAKKSAYPKAGAIGIKLRIIKPGVQFPDKIKINDIITKKKAPIVEKENADAGKTEVTGIKEEVKIEVKEKTEKKAEVKVEKKDKKPVAYKKDAKKEVTNEKKTDKKEAKKFDKPKEEKKKSDDKKETKVKEEKVDDKKTEKKEVKKEDKKSDEKKDK
ncbi:MAG: 30S ribosomal protein S3 [Candidatus Diapherotrites archaeon]